jgi:hypothetical protein
MELVRSNPYFPNTTISVGLARHLRISVALVFRLLLQGGNLVVDATLTHFDNR